MFLPPTPSKGQGWSVLKISNSIFVKTKKFFEIVGKRIPMSLYECFERLKDPRAKSGLRNPLPALLCMITMSYLSGHTGYRATATFMESNKVDFMRMFKL